MRVFPSKRLSVLGWTRYSRYRKSTAAAATATICSLALALAAHSSAAKHSPGAETSVVGGGTTQLANYPYAVGILRDGKFTCSGAVISSTRVLTAAHCARGIVSSRLAVVANRRVLRSGGGEVLGVTSVATHPGYYKARGGAQVNDLAILVLAGATSAPPVALPTPAEDAALTPFGSSLWIAGYGERQNSAFRKSRVGSLASAELFSRSTCSSRYRAFALDSMICASGGTYATAVNGKRRRAVRRSGCFGDSGGPLVANTPSGPRLMGITSYGASSGRKFFFVLCGLKRKPGVYMRVAAHLPFIQANL